MIAELADNALRGRRPTCDAELDALEMAIFAEDVFGIRIDDEDINASQLGTPEAVAKLVAKRLGVT